MIYQSIYEELKSGKNLKQTLQSIEEIPTYSDSLSGITRIQVKQYSPELLWLEVEMLDSGASFVLKIGMKDLADVQKAEYQGLDDHMAIFEAVKVYQDQSTTRAQHTQITSAVVWIVEKLVSKERE
jgi:hypothetical protein